MNGDFQRFLTLCQQLIVWNKFIISQNTHTHYTYVYSCLLICYVYAYAYSFICIYVCILLINRHIIYMYKYKIYKCCETIFTFISTRNSSLLNYVSLFNFLKIWWWPIKMIYDSITCQNSNGKSLCYIIMTLALKLCIGPQGRGIEIWSGESFYVPPCTKLRNF